MKSHSPVVFVAEEQSLNGNYDALCLEQEKQAALNEVLRHALNGGQISSETLTSYVLVMEDQHSAATSAAMTLYELAFQRDAGKV